MFAVAIDGPAGAGKSSVAKAAAKELGFVHPVTGQYIQFDSPLPEYFTAFLARLRKG